jgi:acetyltransferase-like isoleucine patch superfamily enzyme
MINFRDIYLLRHFYRRSKTFFYKILYGLKNVDIDFYFSGFSVIAKDFTTGYHGFMANGCRICPNVSVGNYVMLAPNVTITGSDHRFDLSGVPIIFSGRPILPKTVIESDVWIGDGALIMSGVKIGRGSIVAARAVVTRDIPPFEIHGGVPARFLRSRFAHYADIEVHDAMLVAGKYSGVLCRKL